MELPEVVITCIRLPAIHCTDPLIRSNSCACGAATTSARSAAPRTIAVTERSGVPRRPRGRRPGGRSPDAGGARPTVADRDRALLADGLVVHDDAADERGGARRREEPLAVAAPTLLRGRDLQRVEAPGQRGDALVGRQDAFPVGDEATPPVDRPAPSPPTKAGAFQVFTAGRPR